MNAVGNFWVESRAKPEAYTHVDKGVISSTSISLGRNASGKVGNKFNT
jgi:hypothetical protein